MNGKVPDEIKRIYKKRIISTDPAVQLCYDHIPTLLYYIRQLEWVLTEIRPAETPSTMKSPSTMNVVRLIDAAFGSCPLFEEDGEDGGH
jgi:hypothetical protein